MFDIGPGPIIAVVLGVPAIGFAARMVIHAVADGIARVRTAGQPVPLPADPDRGVQAQRMAQLEAEVASLREEVGRLSSVESFYAQLQAPRAAATTTPPAQPPPAAG